MPIVVFSSLLSIAKPSESGSEDVDDVYDEDVPTPNSKGTGLETSLKELSDGEVQATFARALRTDEYSGEVESGCRTLHKFP